jgi:hypothetical protein
MGRKDGAIRYEKGSNHKGCSAVSRGRNSPQSIGWDEDFRTVGQRRISALDAVYSGPASVARRAFSMLRAAV